MTREQAKHNIVYYMYEDNFKRQRDEFIDQIYNYHETQLKAKDEEIKRLKAIIEEAIKKPMGVEPHSWSDYKMEKMK